MSEKAAMISIRELRSSSTTKRILAGERLTLTMGVENKPIAEIIPLPPKGRRTMDEILAPVKAAASKAKVGKNPVLEDRERFRR
jgi:antitoxin (DNA-binding transcriptional repressor) of toxin-antitoxin stability system